jgi:hypothetical protein
MCLILLKTSPVGGPFLCMRRGGWTRILLSRFAPVWWGYLTQEALFSFASHSSGHVTCVLGGGSLVLSTFSSKDLPLTFGAVWGALTWWGVRPPRLGQEGCSIPRCGGNKGWRDPGVHRTGHQGIILARVVCPSAPQRSTAWVTLLQRWHGDPALQEERSSRNPKPRRQRHRSLWQGDLLGKGMFNPN